MACIEADTLHGPEGRPLVKLNPLAFRSSEDVWKTIRDHDLPYNKLHDRGFASIGCEPCTRATEPNQHERDGRWWSRRDEFVDRAWCVLSVRLVWAQAVAGRFLAPA